MKDTNLYLKTNAQITTTTTGAAVSVGPAPLQPLSFELNVTSITGTAGTLSVKVQDCLTSDGTFRDLKTFDPVTTNTGQQSVRMMTRPWLKYVATLSGTSPDFTFEIPVKPGGRYTQF